MEAVEEHQPAYQILTNGSELLIVKNISKIDLIRIIVWHQPYIGLSFANCLINLGLMIDEWPTCCMSNRGIPYILGWFRNLRGGLFCRAGWQRPRSTSGS